MRRDPVAFLAHHAIVPTMRRFVPRLALLASITALVLAFVGTGVAQRARRHTVAEGDTLARIARRYHTTIDALQAANGLRGDRLRLGEELVVPRPGEAVPAAEGTRRGPTVSQERARARAQRLGLGRASTAQTLLSHPPERAWLVAAGSSRPRGTLQTPVRRGEFIRGWGSGTAGYHLAVDIRGSTGTPILASEAGVVAYSGNAISGYGNFVMLLHPNGLVTAYAHNHQNLVVAGENVTRGQIIAHLGNTGQSHGAHLHYMLIQNGLHCDPLPLFRPRLGPRVRELTWRRGRPPEGIQCLRRTDRPHPVYAARRAEARRARQAAAAAGAAEEDVSDEVGDADDDLEP